MEHIILFGIGFSLIFTCVGMIVLLILAVTWYKLLSKINKWDKRWIKGI